MLFYHAMRLHLIATLIAAKERTCQTLCQARLDTINNDNIMTFYDSSNNMCCL